MQDPPEEGAPDKHMVLDPLGLIMRSAAGKKYGRGFRWEKEAPIPTLFGVDKKFVLQSGNGDDCGPGCCLLAQAVIQQFGCTGVSEDKKDLLETPLSCVRMQMALHYLLARVTPAQRRLVAGPPAEVIEIDMEEGEEHTAPKGKRARR